MFCPGTNKSPVILYLLIILLSKILFGLQVDMDKRDTIVIFVEVQSIMVPCLELFGLKIRCLLDLAKLSQES